MRKTTDKSYIGMMVKTKERDEIRAQSKKEYRSVTKYLLKCHDEHIKGLGLRRKNS